eukprot:359139-Chlamydomonas_euryale.AAC.25
MQSDAESVSTVSKMPHAEHLGRRVQPSSRHTNILEPKHNEVGAGMRFGQCQCAGLVGHRSTNFPATLSGLPMANGVELHRPTHIQPGAQKTARRTQSGILDLDECL